MGRKAGSLALLTLVLLLGSLGPVGRAAAQSPAGTMRLEGQTTWWLPDQPFTLNLDVRSSTPEALEVAVGVYRRIGTRTAFATTVSDGVQGRPAVDVPAVPVAELAL